MTSDSAIMTMAGSIATPVGRWAALGPYYAMFPVRFAYEQISKNTESGDVVVDPFCGRGTTVYAAATTGRRGFGVEINPVGYLYGASKIAPAAYNDMIKRLNEIGDAAQGEPLDRSLPEFFSWAFCPQVRRFLTVARRELNWQYRKVDRTLMALILIYLHGKLGSALSNQMRQTKAMAPDYSIAWWRMRDMRPPKLDPVTFLRRRIDWRYRYGHPQLTQSSILYGDSRIVMSARARLKDPRWTLLLTSPPYRGVTDYWYDQWIRLWLLGHSSRPNFGGPKVGRFGHQDRYRELLSSVFVACAESARRSATIYVRTDARNFTRDTTTEILREVWPRKRMRVIARPVDRPTQTDLFGASSRVKGEVDIILR
jgi:hypothetical protein